MCVQINVCVLGAGGHAWYWEVGESARNLWVRGPLSKICLSVRGWCGSFQCLVQSAVKSGLWSGLWVLGQKAQGGVVAHRACVAKSGVASGILPQVALRLPCPCDTHQAELLTPGATSGDGREEEGGGWDKAVGWEEQEGGELEAGRQARGPQMLAE